MTDFQQIADNLAGLGLPHPEIADAVIKLTNAARAEPLAWLDADGDVCDYGDAEQRREYMRDNGRSDALTPLYANPSRGVVDELEARVEELENELQDAQEKVADGYERDAGRALRSLVNLVPGVEWGDGLNANEQFDVVAEHFAELQAAALPAHEVTIDFPGLGAAGPFQATEGKVALPDVTMVDLAHYFRQGYAALPAVPEGMVLVQASDLRAVLDSATNPSRDTSLAGRRLRAALAATLAQEVDGD